MLEDGVYDVIVVDAEPAGDGARLEVTVLAGAHKGDVVALHTEDLGMDPLDCLGVPGTLTVADGEPRVALDQ